MNFEERLREAVRRPGVPAGFAERVVARIEADGKARRERHQRTRAISAAAAVLVLAVGGWGGWRLEQNRRAEHAAEEAVAALRIASEKINLARDNMERHAVR